MLQSEGCTFLTNPVVTSDLSTPSGSRSAPAEPPRGGPPEPGSAAPIPKAERAWPPCAASLAFGWWGAEICGTWMDNHPATLRCNEGYVREGNKAPLEVLKREWSQTSQPSLFSHQLCTSQGLSHKHTMESGTRNRGENKMEKKTSHTFPRWRHKVPNYFSYFILTHM